MSASSQLSSQHPWSSGLGVLHTPYWLRHGSHPHSSRLRTQSLQEKKKEKKKEKKAKLKGRMLHRVRHEFLAASFLTSSQVQLQARKASEVPVSDAAAAALPDAETFSMCAGTVSPERGQSRCNWACRPMDVCSPVSCLIRAAWKVYWSCRFRSFLSLCCLLIHD